MTAPAVAILTKKIEKSPVWLIVIIMYTFYILGNKTANIIKENWNKFLFVVKVTAVTQQMS